MIAFKKKPGRKPSAEVDLGLALLSVLVKPGCRLGAHDIAAWCGCSKHYIEQEEARALAKLRRAAREMGMMGELSPAAPINFPSRSHVGRRLERDLRRAAA